MYNVQRCLDTALPEGVAGLMTPAAESPATPSRFQRDSSSETPKIELPRPVKSADFRDSSSETPEIELPRPVKSARLSADLPRLNRV